MDTHYNKLLPFAKEAAMSLYEHLLLMNRNKTIRKILAQKVNMNDTTNTVSDFSSDSQSNRFFKRFDNHVSLLAVNDVQKCYERLGHAVDLRDDMALPVAIFFSTMIDQDMAQYWDNENTAPYDIAEDTYDFVKKCFSVDFDENKFLLVELLRDTEVEQGIVDCYATLLYRFALAIASADQCIDDKEQKWLSQILSYSQPAKATEEKVEVVETDNALAQLNSLIGLASVKDEIQRIYNLIKIQKIRESKGMKSSPISYHCVFTGNPGTGKTTVARLVAQIYRELGILKSGHLVETDRSGLVAEYVGQTAVKTNKIIDSALDGVLFIDEAYSLVQGDSNDFGAEAIATLLKRMEDDRSRLVVILAGYSGEMKQFIDSNPGLQSRFNRYIHFEDYNAEDLAAIFNYNLQKFDYELSPAAAAQLAMVLQQAVATKDKNFGNARYVRNLFEKTLERQAQRLAVAPADALTPAALRQILPSDIQ